MNVRGKILFFCIPLLSIVCYIVHRGTLYNNLSDTVFRSLRNENILYRDYASSVWCYLVEGVLRCQFKNLCYAAQEKLFIFVLNDDSVVTGVNLKQIKSIPVSSVADHNLLSVNLAVVFENDSILTRFRTDHDPVFLLWRFKWDNILHVLHDDLIPLFYTYTSLCAGIVEDCIRRYRLAFVDGGEAGELAEWYNVFSSRDPLFLHQELGDSLICFNEAQVGVLGSTTWFQYGFGRPHGPIRKRHTNRNQLYQFTKFILDKFKVQKNSMTTNFKTVVLFSRKVTRKILNESHLKTMIVNTYNSVFSEAVKPHILNLDIATNDTKSIMSAVYNSDIIVGMHGSAMIFSLFLAPGSVVVELFPFGINPQHVSPIKAWAETEASGIIYRSWKNVEEYNSYPHPEAPPLLGGIQHLPLSEQKVIEGTKEVPAVECCHNALYLYRMFQDTMVSPDFNIVFKEALLDKLKFSEVKFKYEYSRRNIQQHYFPAPVSNIICKCENKKLVISWREPFNLNMNTALYKVAVASNQGFQYTVESEVPSTDVPLPPVLLGEVDVDIWIKSVVHEEESIDVYAKCHIPVS